MGLKTKLASIGFASVVMLSSVSAGATVYIYDQLSGTSATSSSANLGSGTRYVTGTGTSGSGKAYAMKVIKWTPDVAVKTISLSANNSAQASFTAQAKNSDGVGQSYYVKWNGSTSSAKANVSIRD
ncbi:MAG: hypothetical protein ACI33J_12365 [Clostridium sp.]